MDRITLIIAPEPEQTKLLMLSGSNEVMRAMLGPARQTHPKAAATLLEGLALWYQQRLSVVLCVDGSPCTSSLELCDGLGYGRNSLHYEVGVALRERQHRGVRLGGPGDFRALRRMCVTEVVR